VHATIPIRRHASLFLLLRTAEAQLAATGAVAALTFFFCIGHDVGQ